MFLLLFFYEVIYKVLDEYRKLYVQSANQISDWKNINRNVLCRNYKLAEKSGDSALVDAYVSAIILNFWHILTKTYNKQPVKILTEEDCYECLVESILFVLSEAAWEDPDQSIYKDERGPEKAINLTFQQSIINLYISNQRHKRKASSNALSLDNTLKDDEEESETFVTLLAKDELSHLLEQLFWKDKVKQYFKERDFVSAFVTDLLIKDPYLIENKDEKYVINSKRVAKELNELPQSYAFDFSREYGVPKEQVESVVRYLYNVTSRSVEKIIRNIVGDIKEESVSTT